MFIYFLLLLLAVFIFLFRNNYTNNFFNKFLNILIFLFSLFILFIIYVFRSTNVGSDYPEYYDIFNSSYFDVHYYQTMERGYRYLNYFAQQNNNFLIIASFTFIITFLGFFILSKVLDINSFTFLTFYIITFLYLFEFNVIREFIAYGIVCLGLSIFIVLYKKKRLAVFKYLVYILFVYLASMFHSSASFCVLFLLLPIFYFRYKHVIYMFIFTTICYFSTPMKEIFNKIALLSPHLLEKYGTDTSSIINFGNKGILQFIPVIFQFYFLFIYMYKNKRIHYSFKYKVILNGYCLFLLLYSGGGDLISTRLQIYTYIFALLFSCVFVNKKIGNKTNACSSMNKYLLLVFWIIYYIYKIFTNSATIVPYNFI